MAGCNDGPFYQLKQLNPVFRKQWEQDRAMGPIFDDRMAEVRKLSSHLRRCPDSEKQQWQAHLENLVANDPSPDIRREAVLAMNHVSPSLTLASLKKASLDENEKVRIAVCSVLGSYGDAESLRMMEPLVTSDESKSVRVAAIQALGSQKGDDAKAILGKALEDRSPALQFQASMALQNVTGKKFGGDVAKWKRYLQGEEVEEDSPSLAERLTDWSSIR